MRYRYRGGQLNRRSFTTTNPAQPKHRHGDGTPIPAGQGAAVIRASHQLGIPADVYCLDANRREYVHVSHLLGEMRAEQIRVLEVQAEQHPEDRPAIEAKILQLLEAA